MNEDDELERSGFSLEAVQQVAAGETQSRVMIPTLAGNSKQTLVCLWLAGRRPTDLGGKKKKEKSQSKVIKFRAELLFSDLYAGS